MNSTTVFRLALGAICFSLTPALPAQTWDILHAFTLGTDLVNPGTTMVEVSPGIYLGSYLGGLFEITPTGTFSVLDDFSSSTYSVAGYGAVAPASNGYFYGIANSPENASAVYRLAPSGKKTIINDALTLSSPLVQGNDGDLWGAQGSDTAGYSVFKMSTGGALTTVASGLNGPTTGPLLQASDGNFYGATYLFSDSPNPGQIYRISPSGNLTILYTFPQGNGSYGGLMQASNGLIYGTWVDRAAQCPNPGGGVFSLSLAGSYKSVLQFAGCYPQGTAIGPLAGLLQASDGRLYGSLSGLGTYNDGSIFSISLNGTSFDKVAEFDYADGASPGTQGAALTQGSDGSLYGTTTSGGVGEGGTVFQFNLGLVPPLPSVRLIQPNSGAAGTKIRLTGNYLLNLTGVSFNGTPANFTSINVNYAEAVVPPGASTGPITVTTSNGSVTTKKSFTVE